MIYDNILKGVFVSRPNRFIANVIIDSRLEICHVKNTGRCKELLTEGATVFVQEINNNKRKTKFDVISVLKNENIINIDSQAPNKVFYEWIVNSDYFDDIISIKPECKHRDSRYDFYIETKKRKIFVEVKGVTLENNGIVKFPDAPTQRGTKHLYGLTECIKEGFESYVFFIAQLKNVDYFEPNIIADNKFYDALLYAQKCGVKIKCLNCDVSENFICVDKFIDVRLDTNVNCNTKLL